MTKPRPTFARVEVGGVTGELEALLLVTPVEGRTPQSLAEGIAAWADALQHEGAALLAAPEVAAGDPWFGFGVSIGETILGEGEVLRALGDDERAAPAVEKFVRALVAFNRAHRDALAGGLFTHDELETGSHAIEWLVTRNLAHLELYLEFLGSLDLEHTLEQVDVVLRLAKTYSPTQLRPLIAWADEHDAQLLNDWLAGERAWKK